MQEPNERLSVIEAELKHHQRRSGRIRTSVVQHHGVRGEVERNGLGAETLAFGCSETMGWVVGVGGRREERGGMGCKTVEVL
jgi:hypothetical protein